MSVSLATERVGGAAHGPYRSGPLELAGLRRRYGRMVALDGLSFTVEPGRIFGFLGRCGAGKTTAVRIVMGIDLPDEGTVRGGGRLLTRADRLAFGYMPEQRGLYPKMRAYNHRAYLARPYGLTTGHTAGACDRWLRRAGIGVKADERIGALPHRNQQRVQLAGRMGPRSPDPGPGRAGLRARSAGDHGHGRGAARARPRRGHGRVLQLRSSIHISVQQTIPEQTAVLLCLIGGYLALGKLQYKTDLAAATAAAARSAG